MTASKVLAHGALALTVAVSFGLAGCASGESPEPAITTAAQATSQPAAVTSAAAYKPADASERAQNVPIPVLPEAAKAGTKEGLEAFATYWFQALNYGYETGNTDLVSAVSSPDCVFCQGLIDNIGLSWSNDKWISGGQIQAADIAAQVSSGAPARVSVQVTQKELVIRNPDGSLYQEPTPATNAGSQATVAHSGAGWTISDLSLIR
ncbi:DUF6318 family protein [Pseudarthrobacter sp. J64]|uniref:DUF6318 family protein n=1 Tax=Pseudarthrobacter sp. J64 TaxID=3116485 RepID=UPI002E7FCE97|nr:DUF6318 family protein [Pseudarthrobacter sp. J64]MEE2569573.1 DUF6318 family protein [Pseudarthrobacter sp. J64]